MGEDGVAAAKEVPAPAGGSEGPPTATAPALPDLPLRPAEPPRPETAGLPLGPGKPAVPGTPGLSALDELTRTKLLLEIRALEFKHSFVGHMIDVLQIVLPLAALFTFAWTVFYGVREQRRQNEESARSQISAAYHDLGSATAAQRTAGVSQLSNYLGSDGGKDDRAIFTAFVDQLALEDEPTIRRALVDALAKVNEQTPRETRSALLEEIADRQLALQSGGGMDPIQLALATGENEATWRLPKEAAYQPDQVGGKVWVEADDQQRRTLNALMALRHVFLQIFDTGARTKHLQGLFCPECSFMFQEKDGRIVMTPAALDGVDLSYAILPGAHFDGAHLNGADFSYAVLSGATFAGAQLRRARFRIRDDYESNERAVAAAPLDWGTVEEESYKLRADDLLFPLTSGPRFDEADLTDADLGYGPWLSILRFDEGRHRWWSLMTSPVFDGATLTGARYYPVAVVAARVSRKAVGTPEPFASWIAAAEKKVGHSFETDTLYIRSSATKSSVYVEALTIRTLIPEQLQATVSSLEKAKDWQHLQTFPEVKEELAKREKEAQVEMPAAPAAKGSAGAETAERAVRTGQGRGSGADLPQDGGWVPDRVSP